MPATCLWAEFLILFSSTLYHVTLNVNIHIKMHIFYKGSPFERTGLMTFCQIKGSSCVQILYYLMLFASGIEILGQIQSFYLLFPEHLLVCTQSLRSDGDGAFLHNGHAILGMLTFPLTACFLLLLS